MMRQNSTIEVKLGIKYFYCFLLLLNCRKYRKLSELLGDTFHFKNSTTHYETWLWKPSPTSTADQIWLLWQAGHRFMFLVISCVLFIWNPSSVFIQSRLLFCVANAIVITTLLHVIICPVYWCKGVGMVLRVGLLAQVWEGVVGSGGFTSFQVRAIPMALNWPSLFPTTSSGDFFPNLSFLGNQIFHP